jgi:hypothetical protein
VRRQVNKNQLRRIISEHLEAVEPECRWCFAIDKVRVKGKEIAVHDYPDALLFVLECPRCGGTFTCHADVVSRDYIEERVHKLHPRMRSHLKEKKFKEILDLVFPEMSEVWKDSD